MYNRCDIPKGVRVDAMYTFFDYVFKPGHYFDGEAHDFYEAVCVLDGKVGITVDSRLLILSAGQVVIHPPMVFHKIWAADNSTPHVVNFAFDGSFSHLASGTVFSFSDSLRELIADLSRRRKEIFVVEKGFIRSILPGKEHQAQIWTLDMERFLLSVKENVVKEGRARLARGSYSKIISVLENNLDKSLRLTQLAKLCEMSCPGLEKTVSRYAGMGVMSYYNYLKMQKASAMLREGSSVKEAAYAVGFSDQNYFSYAFKKIVGKSPKELKNR